MKRLSAALISFTLLAVLFSASALAQNARFQVAHLAPFAEGVGTSVSVVINGTPELENVVYGDSTAYISVPPDTYTIDIVPTGTATVAITATLALESDTDYTVIAIGDGVNQPLELLALVDDNSAPAPGNFKLRLGHLAPFASGAAVLADVRLIDGSLVLGPVDFSDVGDYLELPAGTYNLVITAAGTTNVLINPDPVTLGSGDIVSAFATGDGVNQDLGTFVLPSNNAGFFLGLGATGQLLGESTPIPSLGVWGVLLLIFALGIFAVRQRQRFNA